MIGTLLSAPATWKLSVLQTDWTLGCEIEKEMKSSLSKNKKENRINKHVELILFANNYTVIGKWLPAVRSKSCPFSPLNRKCSPNWLLLELANTCCWASPERRIWWPRLMSFKSETEFKLLTKWIVILMKILTDATRRCSPTIATSLYRKWYKNS
jgi:hypothetical protein